MTVQQHYLLEARQMQALSFAAHIPLVCFGIAFPALVLVAEWLYLRSGDELYRTLARRWSKVMAALFAVGVVTGTILSFEMGLLWPAFTGKFGSVFGLGFAIEGFSFFIEAIFIGIYVYGWNRLSPRLHFASGMPIAAAGRRRFADGDLRQRLDEPSDRLPDPCTASVVDVHPLRALFGNSYFWHEFVHMYIAGYIVTGFLVAARLRRGASARARGRDERTALAIPLTVAALAAPVQILVGDWAGRDVARTSRQARRPRGARATTRGRAAARPRLVHRMARSSTASRSRSCSRFSRSTTERDRAGARRGPPDDRPPVNVVRVAFQAMVGIGTMLALLGVVTCSCGCDGSACPSRVWFYRALVAAGPLSLVALIAGWIVTEVGRQPWVVYDVMRTSQAVTAARGIPVGYGTLAAVYLGLAAAVYCILRRLAAAPLRRPDVHLYSVPLVFALVGLAFYTVLGGADFGTGLWQLTAGRSVRGERLREFAGHAIAPVWEANHVWLIFVLTIVWTAYPRAFESIASTLSIPLFIAAIGIILRGTAYALRSVGASAPIDALFALSSILTPFALGAAAGGVASGRVPVGNAAGDLVSSWLNPTSILVGTLAVAVSAYLAAVFLAADAVRVGDRELEAAFRGRALIAGVVAGAVALAGIVVLHSDAHRVYHRLVEGRGLPAVAVSIAAGLATLALVVRRRYEPARYSAALAVGAIIAGWALAQSPFFVRGLTVKQAAAGHDTLVAVVVAVLAGAVLLFPSLGFLFRLFLGGTFDPGASEVRPPSGDGGFVAPLRRPSVRLPAACLVAGVGFLTVADARWAHAIGVVCLFAFIVSAYPVALPDP